jgi:hypothetical protein
VEIVTSTLTRQQLLDIRETVVGNSGIQRKRARLLARLAYEDGQCCLKLGAANHISQEGCKRGKTVDSRGGHELINCCKVQCAFSCIEDLEFTSLAHEMHLEIGKSTLVCNEMIPESLGVLLLKNGARGEGARKGTNGLGEPVGERSGMGMRPLGASSGMRPPS